MAQTNDWSGLLAEALQRAKSEQLPKTADQWYLLRERWRCYSDDYRSLVLRLAGIAEVLPLEKYSDTQKRAIAMAIADMRTFAKFDEAVIGKTHKRWHSLLSGE